MMYVIQNIRNALCGKSADFLVLNVSVRIITTTGERFLCSLKSF